MLGVEIKYYGNPTLHGYDGAPLPLDHEVIVIFNRLRINSWYRAHEVPTLNQDEDTPYPIAYSV
jgi:hypothetical protein